MTILPKPVMVFASRFNKWKKSESENQRIFRWLQLSQVLAG